MPVGLLAAEAVGARWLHVLATIPTPRSSDDSDDDMPTTIRVLEAGQRGTLTVVAR